MDNRLPLRLRQLQSLLIDLHRLRETTLHRPNVGQAIGATQGKNDIAGLLKPGHALGQRLVSRVQFAAGPVGQPQQRRRRATPDIRVHR